MDLLYSFFGQNPFQQKFQSFHKLVFLIFTYSLSYFYIGYTFAYFTTFQSGFLNKYYGLPLYGFPRIMFVAMLGFGAALGTLVSRIIAQKYPKRQFIMILNAFAILLGLLMLWVSNIYIVLLIRLGQGFCIGIYSIIVPSIIKQVCPEQMQTRFRAINYTLFGFALICVYFLAYNLSNIYALNSSAGMSWIIVCAFPLLIVALQSALLEFMFPFETPKYLLKNNRLLQAQHFVNQFYKPAYAIEVLRKNQESDEQDKKNGDFPFNDQRAQGPQPQIVINNQNNVANPLLPPHRRSKINLFVSIYLVVLQQFSGMTPFIVYGFFYSGNAIPSKLYFPVIFFIFMTFSTQIFPIILAKIAIKSIILVSNIVLALSSSLISYGLYYNQQNYYPYKNSGFLIAGLVLLMINYGCCVGPVFDLYIQEISPNKFYHIIKAIGWAVTGIIILECSIFDWNRSGIFMAFSIWSFISIFVNYKFVIETKGKSKEQIQEQYARMII